MADEQITTACNLDNAQIVDLTRYTIADFFAMTLSDLRDIAAFLGVPAPTKRAKKELVEMIYAVKSGVAPQGKAKKKSTRGRPTTSPERQYYIDWGALKTDKETLEFPNTASGQMKVNDIDDYVFDEEEDFEEIQRDIVECFGTLDIVKRGSFGFLRNNKYKVSIKDPYISGRLIKKFDLREGDFLGVDVSANSNANSPAVVNITSINGKRMNLEDSRPDFEELSAIYPEERYYVNDASSPSFATRMIDLCCPIAKGQRAVVFAESGSHKMDLIKQIACGIKANHPYVSEYVLVLDEMPEDVTDLQNTLDAEIACAQFYDNTKYRLKISDMLIETAKREVEQGRDVVVIVDTLTQLVYSLAQGSNGDRSRVDGVSYNVAQQAKRYFASGKNIEGGGSLTMIAIADLKDQDMVDSAVYSQFHGLGNLELNIKGNSLDLPFSPYVDITKSYVQCADLFLTGNELVAYQVISADMRQDPAKTAQVLTDMLLDTKDNKVLIKQILSKKTLLQ